MQATGLRAGRRGRRISRNQVSAAEQMGKERDRKKKDRRTREALEERLEKLGRRLERTVRERAELMRELHGTGADRGAARPVDTPAPWLAAGAADPEVSGAPAVSAHANAVLEVMRRRRSIKRFEGAPVPREVIERLVDVAVTAPNHHLTEPWRFYILGPAARRAYGEALGARKARRIEDAEAGRMVLEKVAREHAALPAMIAVSVRTTDDEERAREDFAATWMAVQNLCLAACAEGFGTHIKTGAVMDDPAARAAVGVPEEERIVAIVNLGVPEEQPAPKPRRPASDVTFWRD